MFNPVVRLNSKRPIHQIFTFIVCVAKQYYKGHKYNLLKAHISALWVASAFGILACNRCLHIYSCIVSPQTALESKILVASCVGGQGIRLFAKGKGNYSTVQSSHANTEPNQKSQLAFVTAL